jgi:hypothetical protein
MKNFSSNLNFPFRKKFLLSFFTLFSVLLCEAENLGGPYRDFLGLNLPIIGNKWPYRRGSIWTGLQGSHAFINYPKWGTRSGLIPLQANIDYSFDHHWAIGAYIGYFGSTYSGTYGDEKFESRFQSFSGGLRITLHWSDVFNNLFFEVVNIRKWDIYTTTFIGYYSQNWNVAYRYLQTQDFSEGSYTTMGIIMGLRWHPWPKVGLFVEGGKGPVGYLGFGLNVKVRR